MTASNLTEILFWEGLVFLILLVLEAYLNRPIILAAVDFGIF